tara:strand:- start:194 stop:493 length:300 start_codon:yes stop_codon:yes gene_type:complete
MGNNLQKYQPKEVLNKVLNADEDALKVDLDNVTITNANLEVKLDSANDSVALKTAIEADIQTMQDDIALMKADIASMKATTDKLDACINSSNQLEVKTN